MNQENNPNAKPPVSARSSFKRIVKSTVWLAATTAVYVAASRSLRDNPQWSPDLRVGVTLVPLLPGIFYLLSLLQSFRAMDELRRRIQVEAWIFALAGTLVASTVLNVLNANGVGVANYPHGLEIGGVYMSMFIFWSIGLTISNFRYA